MVAIQDQGILAKSCCKYILKKQTFDQCRKCASKSEAIEHILSGRETVASSKYLKNPNRIAILVYIEEQKQFNIAL